MLCLVGQSSPTLFDSIDCSLPGSSVHGDPPGKNIVMGCHAILQGVFPTQGSNPGFPREAQEYWSGEHISSPRDLPDPGIKPGSPALHLDPLPAELPGKPTHTHTHTHTHTFDHTAWLVGSQFPDQELNPCHDSKSLES